MSIKSDFSRAMPDEPGHVHFIGIGGAGMSGIAAMFLAAGHEVSGSDIRDTDTVEALRAGGATITVPHSAEAVAGAHTVVVSGAIAETNPEFLAAREQSLPIVHRAVALSWLTRGSRLVAVAGAHGKTTSTGMIIEALLELGESPSFVNGGVIRSLGVSAAVGGASRTSEASGTSGASGTIGASGTTGASGSTGASVVGGAPLFVVEADESDGSFLLYDTSVALVTNVDPDHLDHFGSETAFEDAFVSFASRPREFVAISSDDPGAVAITPRLTSARVVTFGRSPDADVRVHSVLTGAAVSFVLAWQGTDYPVALRVPGLHNALNAAGAFAVLTGIGFDPRAALDAIATFGGTERRFEFRGEVGGVSVYDDFAHHPTEIRAALTAARGAVGDGRIIPIFQPHLFSRTRMLAQEFADVFEQLADHTIVVPIYGARQDPEPGVTGRLITERFDDRSRAAYFDDWSEAALAAAEAARPGDFIMPMGGGDIYAVIPQLLVALRSRNSGGAGSTTSSAASGVAE